MASRIKFTRQMKKVVNDFFRGSSVLPGGSLELEITGKPSKKNLVYHAPGSVRNLKIVEARFGTTHKNFPIVLLKLRFKETLSDKAMKFAGFLKPRRTKLPPTFLVFMALRPENNELLGVRVASTALAEDVSQTITGNPFKENVLEIGQVLHPKNVEGLPDELKGKGIGGLLTAAVLNEAAKLGINTVKTGEIQNAPWGIALEKKIGGRALKESRPIKISSGSYNYTTNKIVFNPVVNDSWRKYLLK